MLFDLHVHSTLSSCSRLPLEDIFSIARSLGLAGVCITDHDTMGAKRLIAQHDTRDLVVITGMEYSSTDGDFLLFGPVDHIELGLPAEDFLPQVADCGGVAIGAHPFRAARSMSEHVVEQGLCRIVESHNGRNTDAENRQVGDWLAKYPLITTGGSDAHTIPEIGRIPTLFHTPIRNEFDLIRALKAGQCEAAPALARAAGL